MARFGKDMVIYATADLLGSSIGLVLSPIFTRLLTPAQYGAQAALGAIWSFVALAQFGGMDSAYPNFRSRTSDEEERRRLRVTASFIAVISAVVVSGAFGAVGLLTSWITAFAGVSQRELLGYVLTLAPGAIVGWFLYVLRYERRAMAFAGVSLLGRVVGAIVLIPVMLVTVQSERLWVGFLISAVVSALAAVLGWWTLARGGLTPFAARLFDRTEAKAMFRFGIVLVPGFAIYATSTVLDRLLVTWFAGPSETAVLALALRLGAIATMLRTWFALVWDPQLIEWIPTLSRDALLARLQDAKELIARVGAVLVGMAAVWTQPVVTLLYPPEYWATIPLVPWIVLGVAVSALSLVAVATTTMARISKLHLPVYILGLALNLGVGWWWVPKIGAAGAVAGAVVAEAGILGCWIFIGTRYLKNLPLAWLRTWLILIVAAALVVAYRPGFLPLVGVWAERILASVVVLLLFGIPLGRRLWEYRLNRTG